MGKLPQPSDSAIPPVSPLPLAGLGLTLIVGALLCPGFHLTPVESAAKGRPVASPPVAVAPVLPDPPAAPAPELRQGTLSLTRETALPTLPNADEEKAPRLEAQFDQFDLHVRRVLTRHWVADFSPTLPASLRARAELTLSPEGDIKHAKMTSPSKNQEFDESVNKVLSSVESVFIPLPATPDGGEYVLTVEFRLE